MAANPKRLRVKSARAIGDGTRALAIECVEGGAFEACGGKYVIVHTGLVIGDRAVKRAYSLVPIHDEPHAFELCVKKLDGGPGSNAMHALDVGAELAFSGPWGKLLPETGLPARTLLLATDTGITSALGVVEQQRGAGFDDARRAEVLWLRDANDPFLDIEHVRERVERAGARFRTAVLPPVGASDRASIAFDVIDGAARELSPELVIATGDGRIVHPLVDRLAPVAVRIECYFHNPEKKSA